METLPRPSTTPPVDVAASTRTSTSDVVRLFGSGMRARTMLDQWRTRAPQPIQNMLRTHVASTVYRLTPSDVTDCAARTRHPLGDIRKSDIAPATKVRDWWAPLTFTYAFHHLLEQRGTLFTWDEFLHDLQEEPLLSHYLHQPGIALVQQAHRLPGHEHASDALTWRLGNAYYSFLREMYVLAAARAAGYDLRMHPLADVMHRVDAWLGHTTLSIYVDNPKFKTGTGEGRKPRPAQLLADCLTPLRHETLALTQTAQYGRCMFADPATIAARLSALTAEAVAA